MDLSYYRIKELRDALNAAKLVVDYDVNEEEAEQIVWRLHQVTKTIVEGE